ncbi:tail protein X [uncultured Rikenella sp.]|uniref:tail protein X n=1 Tax=uncultured Rikenella sp. TaxID=368003 RepID=UPI00260528DD|nr:tail protein X [uncultured Rikenella sp.]
MIVTISKYGDRWDLLAYDLLGDAALAPALMAANPALVSLCENHIPEGARIVVPEIAAPAERMTQTKAPWKQD